MNANSDELEQRVAERTADLERALAASSQQVRLREETVGELRREIEELSRSNAALEQFAGLASHELQEPLRMIARFAQLLGKRYRGQLDTDADEYIDTLVDGALRMQTLTHDLLTYAKAEGMQGPLVPVGLDDALACAQANLQEAMRISGARVAAGALPRVSGDPVQLCLLFQNLLSNAIKYRREPEPQVSITASRDEREWTISVADNGIGIEARHLGKLFSLFQRLHTRGEYPGTGIGLAWCRRIAERHGGRIWVESEPGLGSTFRFTLPTGDNPTP